MNSMLSRRGVMTVAVAVIAILGLASCGKDKSTSSSSSTTATAASTSSTAASVDTSTAVFPSATSTERFDTPTDAAEAFAVDYLGFVDPVVGEFQSGDAKSGEVPIRPTANGPQTTVLVRQLEGDSWWVLGAATADISVDAPETGARVSAPLSVTGRALAFEGTVQVQLRADDVTDPIATTVVTGGGDVARPFDGTLTFDAPSAANGALVLYTTGAEDGRVWQATVLRVTFG
jgi:hypothetical protein